MKRLTLFYLEDCPYCRNAKRALAQLRAENPAYEAVEVEWVEESRSPARAAQFDYYYVPAVFLGTRKLYEAHPGEAYDACRERLRAALDAALRQN